MRNDLHPVRHEEGRRLGRHYLDLVEPGGSEHLSRTYDVKRHAVRKSGNDYTSNGRHEPMMAAELPVRKDKHRTIPATTLPKASEVFRRVRGTGASPSAPGRRGRGRRRPAPGRRSPVRRS